MKQKFNPLAIVSCVVVLLFIFAVVNPSSSAAAAAPGCPPKRSDYVLDVVFVHDLTKKTQPREYDYNYIMTGVENLYPGSRYGLITSHDYSWNSFGPDDRSVTLLSPLTTDRNQIVNQINTIPKYTTCTTCEEKRASLLAASLAVTDTRVGWTADGVKPGGKRLVKLVVLITDAAPLTEENIQGLKYFGDSRDNHLTQPPKLEEVGKVFALNRSFLVGVIFGAEAQQTWSPIFDSMKVPGVKANVAVDHPPRVLKAIRESIPKLICDWDIPGPNVEEMCPFNIEINDASLPRNKLRTPAASAVETFSANDWVYRGRIATKPFGLGQDTQIRGSLAWVEKVTVPHNPSDVSGRHSWNNVNTPMVLTLTKTGRGVNYLALRTKNMSYTKRIELLNKGRIIARVTGNDLKPYLKPKECYTQYTEAGSVCSWSKPIPDLYLQMRGQAHCLFDQVKFYSDVNPWNPFALDNIVVGTDIITICDRSAGLPEKPKIERNERGEPMQLQV